MDDLILLGIFQLLFFLLRCCYCGLITGFDSIWFVTHLTSVYFTKLASCSCLVLQLFLLFLLNLYMKYTWIDDSNSTISCVYVYMHMCAVFSFKFSAIITCSYTHNLFHRVTTQIATDKQLKISSIILNNFKQSKQVKTAANMFSAFTGKRMNWTLLFYQFPFNSPSLSPCNKSNCEFVRITRNDAISVQKSHNWNYCSRFSLSPLFKMNANKIPSFKICAIEIYNKQRNKKRK